jgi:hypothetical protein
LALSAARAIAQGQISYYEESVFHNFHNAKEVVCVYPGSFALVHEDHERVFKTCEELYGAENCFLELSISNFSKPDIDSIEVAKRVEQMRKISKNILITRAPMMVDKIAALDKGQNKIVFAVGFDTFARVALLSKQNVSFLVFPRDGKFVNPDFGGPGEYCNKIEPQSFDLKEGQNLSSSALIKEQV